MAVRLSFVQLDAKLKSATLTSAEYGQYIEVDPTSVRVHVRIKPGSLSDAPPPGYDVDRQVYLSQQIEQHRKLATLLARGLKRVVAEGDSWFNLPPIIRPEAIAQRLSSDKLVAVKNIAHWGDTLAQMLKAKQYLAAIAEFDPEWFILSGGGNDLQDLLSQGKLVEAYDPARPIDQCLTSDAVAMLEQIAVGYRSILAEISSKYPKLTFICYAYDYPRPTWKSGKYIGQYLKKMNYPKGTWDSVTRVMIDRLSACIEPVVNEFTGAHFLDCRGTTAKDPFFDDMHPDSAGFRNLAHRFEQALGVATASAGARARRLPAVRTKHLKPTNQGRRPSPQSAPKPAAGRRKRADSRRARAK